MAPHGGFLRWRLPGGRPVPACRANRRGLPRNPLQFAVLAHAYRHELAPPSRAARVLAAPVLVVLALLGRACGLRARYPEFSSD